MATEERESEASVAQPQAQVAEPEVMTAESTELTAEPEPLTAEAKALAALRDRLLVTPPRTDFFTAVMMLERMTPEHDRIGGMGSFEREALTFRHSVSFGFQPNDICSIRWAQIDETMHPGRYEVTTCVLGLSGADSPLPLYHVEDLVLETDAALVQAAFLDIFHNRLTALLYRSRVKFSPPHEYLTQARDPLSRRLLAAAGVDRYDDSNEDALNRSQLLGLVALIATGGGTCRSIENSLRQLLSHELGGSPLKLEQLCGGWIAFDPDQRTSLGHTNSSMAVDWILGTRVRHPAHRAKVVVGPMPPQRARDFSPGGRAFERTRRLIHALCRDPIAVELELLIDQDAFPPFFLRANGGRVLGEDVFLSSRRREGKIIHRVFDLETAGKPGGRRAQG